MRFTDASTVEWIGQQTPHRGAGGYAMKTLLQGDENTPENYWMFVAKGDASYTSPRHRHNFDQFRFVLEGHANMAPRQNIEAGEIGYFPEGVAYGPQVEDVKNVMMMIQFGASESGYLSPAKLKRAHGELAKGGTFEGGVYRRPGARTRKNQDAFEAVWEYSTGRNIVYAAPRYAAPVVMKPDNFQWRELGEGVAGKSLGSFSERQLSLQMIRLEPKAAWRVAPEAGIVIVFFRRGAGDFAGHRYAEWCAAEILAGEEAKIVSQELTELLVLTLPPIPRPVATIQAGTAASHEGRAALQHASN